MKTLATDYDGTLATAGNVDKATVASLLRLQGAGWRLILVTGRVLEDLQAVFPEVGLFDCVVAENGALLYRPQPAEIKLLAAPPPAAFVEELQMQGVPLGLGRVIVATVIPHEQEVFKVIARHKLPLEVIFNKGAVMVLPKGVDKASGLKAAAAELRISLQEMVGVGDAENDGSFLQVCGMSVAVANALPALKKEVDIVLMESEGAGVRELVERLLST